MTTLRLITIPISHYCERARWALDYVGLEYREEQHLQLLHWPHAWASSGGKTVPVLVTSEGVLSESEDMVRYAHDHARNGQPLYPDDDTLRERVTELERGFQDSFGVESRKLIYGHAFRWGRPALDFNAARAPRWERRALHVGFPLVKRFMRRYLQVNATAEAVAKEHVQRVFDHTAELLSDGRRYLVGHAFSAADLTFACMAAAVLCPPEYGIPLPQPEDVPEDFARDVTAFRVHPAGSFAMRMFRDHRRPCAPERLRDAPPASYG
ncbi:MAG: glutathione S-transferase [Polyangiales bacterium]